MGRGRVGIRRIGEGGEGDAMWMSVSDEVNIVPFFASSDAVVS